jgi:putative hydrolase of the HAD superfamily
LLRALFSGNDDTVLVGRVSEEEWWEVVRQRLETSTAEIHELRSDLQRRGHVDGELLQFVRDVGDGVKQALVSNAWPGMRVRLSAGGLDGLFDEIVISAEVGAAKPMPKIFEIAGERLAVPPEDFLATLFWGGAPTAGLILERGLEIEEELTSRQPPGRTARGFALKRAW